MRSFGRIADQACRITFDWPRPCRHRLFQDCLRGILSRDRRYRVSPFEHASPTVIEQLREAVADVVIIDAGLPNGRGSELIRAIRQQLEGVRVLAITSTAAR